MKKEKETKGQKHIRRCLEAWARLDLYGCELLNAYKPIKVSPLTPEERKMVRKLVKPKTHCCWENSIKAANVLGGKYVEGYFYRFLPHAFNLLPDGRYVDVTTEIANRMDVNEYDYCAIGEWTVKEAMNIMVNYEKKPIYGDVFLKEYVLKKKQTATKTNKSITKKTNKTVVTG